MEKIRESFVSPSLLAVKGDLKQACIDCEKFGADYIHFDVMDGIFVPNISFSFEDFKCIKDSHNLINDVHIMVKNVDLFAREYIKLGADIITFHLEALDNKNEIISMINLIRNSGVKVGMSIKPNTDVNEIIPFLSMLDLVLVMSVEPGKGGQSFIESSLNKIKVLRSYIDNNNLSTLIEVDGGINAETGKMCKEAGVDILVAGSYVFKDNIEEKIRSLK